MAELGLKVMSNGVCHLQCKYQELSPCLLVAVSFLIALVGVCIHPLSLGETFLTDTTVVQQERYEDAKKGE